MVVIKWRKVWTCKVRRKQSNTPPLCLWFSSNTTIVLLQCNSNKMLMMYSNMRYFVTLEPFCEYPPCPVKSVSRLHSFDSFVCIVKTLRAICCKNPKEALFSIVSVCVHSLSDWLRWLKRSDLSQNVIPDLFNVLSELAWHDDTNVWMRPRCSLRLFWVMSGKGFVFHVRTEQKIITTNC